MFEQVAIVTAGQSWEVAQDVNQNLLKLKSLLLDEVRAEGNLAKSKLAWKLSILTQSLLYRLNELAESCCLNWNSGHHVSSIILARALMETGAIFYDLAGKIDQYVGAKNLDAIDKLVMNRTFASRLDELISDVIDNKAVSILSIVQKMDKTLPGFEGAYNRMSEFAHPNQMGHFQAYADLDKTKLTANFGVEKMMNSKFSSITCALSIVELSCLVNERIQENINKIAEL